MTAAVASDHTLSLIVPGIHCAGCTRSIEKALQRRREVSTVRANLADRRVTVNYDAPLDANDVADLIRDAGFEVSPDLPDVDFSHKERKRWLGRLGVAGIGMMQVMMFALASYLAGGQLDAAYEALFRYGSLALCIPVVLYSAQPFFSAAVRDLRNGVAGMDVPVSLAILAAFVLSVFNTLIGGGEVYFDTVCMFTFFLLIGRFMEAEARQGFMTDQTLFTHLVPTTARLETREIVDTDRLQPGDRIRVFKDEPVPADGVIVSGTSSLNESAFTGEPLPVGKTTGSKVYAGSGNIEADLVVEVTAMPADTMMSQVARLYEQTVAFRPGFVALADQVASYFITGILLIASLAAAYWWMDGGNDWFVVALTVLVVACPCALSLATPVAYTVSILTLRKNGLVVANGEFLERLSAVTQVFLDKTGTLTLGDLKIAESFFSGGQDRQMLLGVAKALQRNSAHPVARAFDNIESTVVVTDPWVRPGWGVGGVIDDNDYTLGKPVAVPNDFSNSVLNNVSNNLSDNQGYWIELCRNDDPIAWFRLEDRLRDNSADVVDALRHQGKSVGVLTGDSSKGGESALGRLGIGDVHWGLSPGEKSDIVRDSQKAGHTVLMVGDGINDTVAMGGADVSLAVNPVDVALQSAADAVLLNGDLGMVNRVCSYADRIKRVITQNVTWAIGYNLAVIPLAVTGILAPWMAALGMSFSSVVVIVNANRLRRM